jgi:hypothetical protein
MMMRSMEIRFANTGNSQEATMSMDSMVGLIVFFLNPSSFFHNDGGGGDLYVRGGMAQSGNAQSDNSRELRAQRKTLIIHEWGARKEQC